MSLHAECSKVDFLQGLANEFVKENALAKWFLLKRVHHWLLKFIKGYNSTKKSRHLMKYTHKLAQSNIDVDVTKQDFVRLYSLFLSRFLCTIFSSLCSPHLSSARSITTLLIKTVACNQLD